MNFESFRKLSDAEKRQVLSAMERDRTPAPFPLTDLQQAFFAGRRIGEAAGATGCQLYLELALHDLDLERLRRAWLRLATRHDLLRACVRADGRQEIRAEPSTAGWIVSDLAAAAPQALAAHLDAVRRQLTRTLFQPDQWPLYEIRITAAPARWFIVHLAIDEWIVDAASLNLLLVEWRRLYDEPDAPLPPLAGSFREYVAALQRFESTPRFRAALAYWLKKLDPLPARPLPRDRRPDAEGEPRTRRHGFSLGARAWERLRRRASQAGASPTALLLAAFGSTLQAYVDADRSALILTWFNRPPLQPDIDRMVGPFTSTGLFVVDRADTLTPDQRIASCQQQLWSDLDHNVVGGIRAIRELRTRGVAPASYAIPIVFTSMLHTADAHAHDGWLGKVTTLISQTPQVDLDCQVVQRGGRLFVYWDVPERRFPPGSVERMLAAYRRTLETWAESADVPQNDAPPLLVVESDVERRYDEFALTDVQQSYLSARGGAGDESCQIYQEFEAVDLDVPRLQDAWRRLIDAHEMLRAVILPTGRQRILPQTPAYEIRVENLAHEPERGLERVRHEMTHGVFTLGEWPFFDVRVSRIDPRRSRIHVVVDSLLVDGPSVALLFAQWFASYEDAATPLAAPALSFRDYRMALQRFQSTPVAAECEAYWLEALRAAPRGLPPALIGQSADERASGRVRRAGVLRAWRRLEETAARYGVDSEIVLLTAFTEVLGRSTAADAPASFTTVVVDWRRLAVHPDVSDVVGDFTGLCWLVNDASPGATFVDRLRRHDRALKDDRRRAAVSGLSALRRLRRAPAPDGGGLSVVFSAPLPRRDLRLPSTVTAGYGVSRTPGVLLDGIHVEVGDDLHFHWDTMAGALPADLVDRAFARYEALLNDLAQCAEWDTADWETLTERRATAADAPAAPAGEWSVVDGPSEAYPLHQCLHDVIEAQAARTPDAEAVVFQEERLTYADLNARANRVAHRLRRLGVGPDTLVAVMMERSTELIVALLGILKAGGAYLPLDPEYPEDRLRFVLADAMPAALLTQARFDHTLPDVGLARLRLDAGEDDASGEPSTNAPRATDPDHLAYVIYTSGSTGRPKGCLIPHRAICNRLFWMQQAYPLDASDRVVQKTPATFDVSVWEFFWPLMTGAALVLAAPGGHRNPRYLADLMRRERVTTTHFVPPMLALFLAEPDARGCVSLRRIVTSGEALPYDTAMRCLDLLPAAALHNLYGPTEAAVDVTAWTCERRPDRKIPIGRPIANTRIAILDGRGEPVPRGVEGELHIGGVNLARGYLNRDDLTRERFIADRTDPSGAGRFYKTGDRARLLPEGNIEFLGRLDFQVKVRGHRVEPGEIEQALRAMPEIAEAVVLVREAQSIDPLLVAYCACRPDRRLDEERVRRALRQTLPAYMVPNRVIFLPALPVTRHGKIDRDALPWPVAQAAVSGIDAPAVAPASGAAASDAASHTAGLPAEGSHAGGAIDVSALEEEIAAFVREALQDTSIDPDKDLFDQGATSFLVVQLAQRLEKAHGTKLSVDLFLEAPSVRGIARHVAGQRKAMAAPPPDEVNFFSPEQRERFKARKLHLRHDVAALAAVPLRSTSVDPITYEWRSCARGFAADALSFEAFRDLLSTLRQGSVDGAPKYLYPSAGALYGVQVYVLLKPGAVDGLAAGAYYYHPVEDALYRLSDATLDRSHHFYYNRPHYDEAAFALIFMAARDAVAPIYGDEAAVHFAAVEAGYMGQLLMTRAPEHGIGLLPIGAVDVKHLRDPFRLSDSHVLIHYILGGPSRIAHQWRHASPPRSLSMIRASEQARDEAPAALAVTGVSGRYPGADTPEALWAHLAAGHRSIDEPPDDRRAMGLTKAAGFVNGIDRFDHRLFRISPIEARALDPAERLFLEVVWECLERAGYTASALNRSAGRVGVFVGVMWNDYLSAGMALADGEAPRSLGFHSSIANRVASFFDFKGPSLAVDSSCSSALTALHLACESVRRGECGAAIVGGVNVLAHPSHPRLLDALNLLAGDGHSRAFSAEASGWAAGEGIGAVLIRPVDAATRGRDTIHGRILGTAARHLGRTGEYGAPDAREQGRSIADALTHAGVAPETIDYVEVAAAGASLADAAEVEALVQVFGRVERTGAPCRLGSIKPNIGHLEAASGLSQLTKVLLQFEHRAMAPSIEAEPLNPLLRLAGAPLAINRALTLWPPAADASGQHRARRALINAFGATGTCAHVILEASADVAPVDEPSTSASSADTRTVVVPLSAASAEQLATLARRLRTWIAQRRDAVRVADVAFTLQSGREPMAHRLALVVEDVEELLRTLDAYLLGEAVAGVLTMDAGDERPVGRTAIERAASDWVERGTIAWETFQRGDERRIPLPTYPFAPVRHWIDRPSIAIAVDRTVSPNTAAPAASASRLQAVEERLRAIFAEELDVPVADLRSADSFESHGVNSFLIARLMARLEREGLKVPTSALFYERHTITALAQALDADAVPGLDRFVDVSGNESRTLPAAADARATASNSESRREPRAADETDAIAIVGMAGRYPQARDLDEYWRNLAEGRDCVTEVPRDRWDHEPLFDSRPGTPGRAYSRWGGFIDEVDCGDPLFFNLSPREAAFMDPQERVFLEIAWSALEDAGYTRRTLTERLDGDVGVFVGVMYGDHQLRSGRDGAAPLSVSFGSIANRVSHFLDLGGPSFAVDTMCSSSLTALHLACESLRRRECRAAIVGGVNLCLHPNRYLVQSQARMSSTDGRCRAFGAGGDGFVPGEGAGAAILRPLRDAEADGDRILAVIRATSINHDGHTRAYAVPSPVGHGTLIRRALDRAGIPPESISYVEVHGTGTALGDPIELSGLSKAFGQMPPDWSCAIGSVKSNIGHLEPAAGIAALTKLVLQIVHRELAPSLHAASLNPNIDWDRLPFRVQQTRAPWTGVADPDGRSRLRAGVSSFGAGGANGHAIVEDYPSPSPDRTESIGPQIVVVSARTESSLRAQAGRLARHLDMNDVRLADLVRTLANGREAMPQRLAIVASTVAEISERLHAFAAGRANAAVFRGSTQTGTGVVHLLERDEIDRLVTRTVEAGHLDRVADLWANGLDVDWSRLRAGQGHIVSLPTYAFDREPLPLPRIETSSSAAAQMSEPAESVKGDVVKSDVIKGDAIKGDVVRGDVLLCEWAWRPDALSPTSAHAATSADVSADATLVFDDDEGVWSALTARGGSYAIRVRTGGAFERIAENAFTIRPGVEEDLGRLVESVRRDGRTPRRIVHLWSRAHEQSAPLSMSDVLARGIHTLFGLVRRLNGALPSEVIRLLCVHGGTDALSASAGAALAGFARAVALEHAAVHTTLLEVPAIGREDLARVVIAELARSRDGVAVLTMSSQESTVRNSLDAALSSAFLSPVERRRSRSRITANGLYLVTGGAGGLGVLFARHLLRTYGAHVILAGRSPASRRADLLADLSASGGRVEYLSCDLSDPAEVRTLMTTVRSRGVLKGVIHAAGVLRDARLRRKTRHDLDAVLAPKALGLIHLDDALADERLDFFALFSSLGAATGNIGQCDYAFANSFLDRFARERNALVRQGRRHGHTCSIAWPLWADGGMQIDADARARLTRRTGLEPLPASAGIEVWEELIASERDHTIVLFGDAPRLRDVFFSRPAVDVASTPAQAPVLASTSTSAVASAPTAATSPQPVVARQAAAAPETVDVRAATTSLVRVLLGKQLQLDPERISTAEPLESYGIDSIAVAQFNESLESIVGPVSPGLLFEAPTVSAVVDALLRTHAAPLAKHAAASQVRVEAPSLDEHEAADDTPASTIDARVDELMNVPAPAPQPRERVVEDGIAIVGVAGRYPQAHDVEAFWTNLCAGRDSVDEVPLDRWDYRPLYDPDPTHSKDGTLYGKWGAFLEDAMAFDCRFFGISPREAEILDPQERLFLEIAWAACEDAGYTREGLRRATGSGRAASVGVFVGVTSNTYLLWGPEQWAKGNRVLPATAFWSIANRVSYHMNFSGPSMPVDTACSSSLVAVHLACESIRRGECQMAIVGGVNLYLHPSRYVQMSQIRMLSPTGRCRSFGAQADGMVPGEGVGAVLLKPLARAVADGDCIHGVIRATSVNHDGRTNGFTVPNTAAQADLVRHAISVSGCDARTITCVEAHGSGTSLGDPVEVDALSQAFRDHTRDAMFCAIGSVKSNIGHLESAAGIAGLTKVLLQMRHRLLAPSLHAGTANPAIDFTTTPFRVQRTLEPWRVDASNGADGRLRAGVSSFGAGGANAHAIVEDYVDERGDDPGDADEPQILVLSARDDERLREYASRMANHLEDARRLRLAPLADVACTLQVGREAMTERVAFVARDRAEAVARLRAVARGEASMDVRRGRVKRAEPLDADGERRVAHAMTSRDLHGVADEWIRGSEIDWARFHDTDTSARARRRVTLPTYPFERRHYWLPGTGPDETATPTPMPTPTVTSTAPSGAAASETAHHRHPWGPLVIADAARTRVEATLDPSMFAIADHHIDGAGVLPATAALELVFEAVRVANGAAPARLRHVNWLRPIVFASTARRLAVRFVHVADAVRFELMSDEEGAETIYVRGFLGGDRGGTPPASEPDVLRHLIDRLPLREDDTAAIYGRFARYGTDYGPSFRVVVELRGGVDEAIARLDLPAALQSDASRFHLHPALVDGALHAIAGLEAAADAQPADGPCVPFSVGEVWTTGALPTRGYTHVKQTRPGDPCYDVTIYDDEGRARAGLREFRLRRIRTAASARVEQTPLPESPRAESIVAVPIGAEPMRASDVPISADVASATVYYAPVWRETPLPAATGDAVDVGRVWVFVRRVERAASIAHARVIVIEPGPAFEERGSSRVAMPHAVRDGRSVDAWRQLVGSLVRAHGMPSCVVHACALDLDDRTSTIDDRLDAGIRSIFPLTQALMEQPGRDAVTLLFAYPGGEEHPEHQAVGAFAKTLALESTRLTCATVAVDATENGVLAAVLSERHAGDREVRRRGARRWVRTLEEVTLAPDTRPAVDIAGVWLVTGGAGALGRLFASHLLARGADAVALAGRSTPGAGIAARVRDIGASAHYFQTDLSERASVHTLISDIRRRLGPVRGVVHAAGLTRDALIRTTSREQLDAVLAPKVLGARHLDEALASEPLEAFVLFSSMAGLTGNQGQAAYAYANAFLDDFARAREVSRGWGDRRGRTVAIDWPLWREGGMHPSAAVERWYRDTIGIAPMPTRDGLDAFDAALRSERTQLAIVHGDARRIRAAFSRTPEIERSDAARIDTARTESAQTNSARTDSARHDIAARVSALIAGLAGEILKLDAGSIELDDDLAEFGFDSVSFTELASQINIRLGLTETPALFYEQHTLAAVANSLIERHAASIASRLEALSIDSTRTTSASMAPAPTEAPIAAAVEATSAAVQRVHDRTTMPIAIVGMSAVFPGAPDLYAFWRLLVQGRDAISEIPRDRWDWKAIFGDPHQDENKTDVRWGAFLDRVDLFDAEFFGISPHEARLMDPQQRLFVETVWKTIEDAGWKPSDLAGTRTGVFAGVGTFEFVEVLRRAGIGIEPHSATGVSHCILANRVSYLLDLRGPSEPIDTGCSASLVAVHRAIEAIRGGSCDQAIAGGVNVMVSPATFIAFNKAGMLSPDGRCKTFDARADGYVRGEGVGAVLLKPLDRAERDGDTIHAIIRGSAVNHGGYVNTLTSPNPAAQADVIVRAFQQAGVGPSTVGLIEAHGSGTKLGDPVEINGLTLAFDELARDEGVALVPGTCGVGSVKTNIGHLESAAGIAGLLKVLLALRHRTRPPSVNFRELNPFIRLDNSPLFIVDAARPWPAPRDASGRELPRRAGVSSFGFGGANAHLVVEEWTDVRMPAQVTNAGPELIVLSGRTDDRLRAMATALRAWCGRADALPPLADIAHTLQVGRDAMESRAAFVAGSVEELTRGLDAIALSGPDASMMAGVPRVYRGQVRIRGRMVGRAAGPDAGRIACGVFDQIAEAWCQGASVDWTAVRSRRNGTSPRRVSLPTYPFEPTRHWPLPETSPEMAQPAERSTPQERRESARGAVVYRRAWRPLSSSPNTNAQPPDPPVRSVLLIGDEDLCAAWRDAMAARWSPAAVSCAAPDIVRQFDTPPDLVLWLFPDAWRLTGLDSRFPSDADELDREIARDLRRVVTIVKDLNDAASGVSAPARPRDVLFILNAPDNRAQPHLKALSALARSLRQEGSPYRCATLALPFNELGRSRVLDILHDVHSSHRLPDSRELAYVQDRLVEPFLDRLAGERRVETRLRAGAVYVITGGLGEVGRPLAAALVKRFGATVVLIGRREPSPAQAAEIARMQAGRAQVIYVAADVCDPSSLDVALADVRKRVGPVNGVFHLARTVEDALFTAKDHAAFERVARPKIAGTIQLDLRTSDDPLDFFVLFSSMAGLTGLRGGADYAYACEFQTWFAEERRARVLRGERRGATLAVCWSQWRHDRYLTDSKRARAEERGLALVDVDAALDAIDLALAHDAGVVAPFFGDVDRIRMLVEQPHAIVDTTARDRVAPVVVAASEPTSPVDREQDDLRDALRGLSDAELDELRTALFAAAATEHPSNAATPPASGRATRDAGVNGGQASHGVPASSGAAASTEASNGAPNGSPDGARMRDVIREVLGKVLELRSPLLDDTRFERLGMDSILGAQVAMQLERRLNMPLPPRWLLEHDSVDALVHHLAHMPAGVAS